MFISKSESVRGYFNCGIETEGFLETTTSHVHYKMAISRKRCKITAF